MDISIGAIISWVLVGALVGSLLNGFRKKDTQRAKRWTDLGIGLAGAVLGGFLFKIFKINLGLETVQITAQDVVAGLVGALVFLLIVWIINKQKKPAA